MNPITRIVKNSAALSTNILVERAISFVLPWYIARVMGKDAMGEYNLALTFITLFTPIGVWGLNQLLPRLIARDSSQTALYLIHASLLGIATSVLATTALIVTVQLLDYPTALRNLILLGGLSVLLRSESTLCEAIIKGTEKMEWVAIVRLPITIARVPISIFVLSQGKSLYSVFILMAISQLFVWASYLWMFKRTLPELRWQVDWSLGWGLLLQSLPFMVIAVLGVTFKQIDRVFLSKLWDTEMVGVYSTGALFVQVMHMLAPALMESLFPSLSRLYLASRQRFTLIVAELFKLVFIAIIPVTLGLFTLAEFLILQVFGPEYDLSITVFRILVWAIIPSYLGRLLFRAILASNNEKVMPRVVIVNDIVNIALNILLIPRYGIVGASVAAIATELCGLIQNAFFVYLRISRVNLKETVAMPVACALISMIVFVLVAQWSIYLAWLVSTVVLVLTALISRTVTAQSISKLSEM